VCRGSSLVERRPEKAGVASSILAPGTIHASVPSRSRDPGPMQVRSVGARIIVSIRFAISHRTIAASEFNNPCRSASLDLTNSRASRIRLSTAKGSESARHSLGRNAHSQTWPFFLLRFRVRFASTTDLIVKTSNSSIDSHSQDFNFSKCSFLYRKTLS
jgi:hypothetical protein